MMKNREFSHQGDVQLIEIDALPADAKKIDKKPVALGELSGHQHVITGDYELLEDDGFVYAKIGNDGAMLQHIHESNFTSFDTTTTMPPAEHSVVTLEPNKVFKIGIHKKYAPFKKVYEKVID